MTKFIDACGAQQAGIDAQIQEQRMSEQIPTIGRIVHYRLSEDDAAQINRRRTTGHSIARAGVLTEVYLRSRDGDD